MSDLRALHLVGATGKSRTEIKDGKEYLVVPVVALMEGVIHAVNAQHAEYVPFSTIQKAASSWNGRPITVGHPTRDGKQCSANDPGIFESHVIGTIFNSRADEPSKKLLQEAWIEKVKAKKIHPDMYERLAADKTEEVSVGAFVVTDTKDGTHTNGKAYKGSWLETTGDHLAFLPGGRGACSVEMGCGTHRAAMRVCGEDFEVLGDVPGHEFHGNQFSADSIGAAHESARGTLQLLKGETLSHVTSGKIDLNQKAGHELASRGLNKQGKWVGFSAAEKIHGSDAADKGKEGNPHPQKEDVRGVFQTMHESALVHAVNDKIDLNKMASHEAASRGHDKSGKWVGFEKAAKIHGLKTAAGARNSAADQKMIQTMHDHAVSLGADCGKELRDMSAITTLEGASLDERMNAVSTAVYEKYGSTGAVSPSVGAYPQKVFDDHVIVQKGQDLFSCDYDVAEDGTVKLSDKMTPVRLVQKYVAAAMKDCPTCDGTGQVTKDGKQYDCPSCDGEGVMKAAAIRTALIKHEGGRWTLYTKDGSRRLGTHDTEAQAKEQEAAIEAAKQRRSRELSGEAATGAAPCGCHK